MEDRKRQLTVIVRDTGMIPWTSSVVLSNESARQLIELAPVLAAAHGRDDMTLAETVVALAETQMGTA